MSSFLPSLVLQIFLCYQPFEGNDALDSVKLYVYCPSFSHCIWMFQEVQMLNDETGSLSWTNCYTDWKRLHSLRSSWTWHNLGMEACFGRPDYETSLKLSSFPGRHRSSTLQHLPYMKVSFVCDLILICIYYWKIWFCISYKTHGGSNKHGFILFMRDNM